MLRAWGKLRRAAGLEPKGLGVGHGHAKGCAASLDAAALDVIAAPGEQWEGLKGALRDVWGGHKEDARKVGLFLHIAAALTVKWLVSAALQHGGGMEKASIACHRLRIIGQQCEETCTNVSLDLTGRDATSKP